MGRPVSTKSMIAYSYVDIQVFATEGLQAIRESDRGKEARCFEMIISVAQQGAREAEGIDGK